MLNFAKLLDKARDGDDYLVAVAQADDEQMLEVVMEGLHQRLARFQLYGNKEKILNILEQNNYPINHDERLSIYHTTSLEESARRAVQAVREKKADVLMKGQIPTAMLLKEVLNKEYGLRTNKILSQVAMFEIPNFSRPIFVTDAAMNILPSVEEKVKIIENAVQVTQAIGIEFPKVAPIAAVEVVNPKMEATVDAAILSQMNRRGQIKGCIIDGPLGLDNAISVTSADHKGIHSEVSGRADILLVPTIEVGNVLYKSLTYFAKAKVGSVLVGALAPIVLTSRTDNVESKLNSLALALLSVKNHSTW